MSEKQIQITGKVNGAYEVAKMMAYAPKNFLSAFRKWLYGERTRFVGKPKGRGETTLGKFGKSVTRKPHKGRSGVWSKSAAMAFRGFIGHGNDLNGMYLRMGLPRQHESDFVKGLAEMENGGASFSSGQFMPIPIWSNLQSRGIDSKSYKAFRDMAANNQLYVLRRGGKVIWMLRPGLGGPGNIPMFVGQKQVNPGPINLGFESRWEAELPRAINRSRNVVDKTIRGLEKEYIKLR